MYPVSDRYRANIWRGGRCAIKAEILADDEVVLDLTDMGVLLDGSVTCSYNETARTAAVSIVDKYGELAPYREDDLLAPGGNQIRLYRGLVFEDDTIEYVPLITARYTAVDMAGGLLQLQSMYDRSWIVAGAKLESVLNIPLGTNVIDAIEALLRTAYPGVPMNFPTSDETCNAMTFETNSDPWAIAQELAANIGYRLVFDPMGVAVMISEPDPSDSPVWRFDDLDPTNMMLPGHTKHMSGLGYNCVQVYSENSDLLVPLHATAKDLDPSSAMQYGGKFGRRVLEVRDEKISTQAQADQRAVRELGSQLGLLETFEIPVMPWPCGDVLDPVFVNVTQRAPLIDSQTVIVDSITTPLRAKGGPSMIATRGQRVVTVE